MLQNQQDSIQDPEKGSEGEHVLTGEQKQANVAPKMSSKASSRYDLEALRINHASFSTSLMGDMSNARGLNIGFHQVTLTVDTKKKGKSETRTILDKMSGSVKAGKLTAIMGPSGSGKSSLLSVLAGRTKASKGVKLSGSLTAEGKAVKSWDSYRRVCAFVEQDDLLFPNLTVRETLTLAAELRLPREMTAEDRTRRVDAVVAELGLKKCEMTRIGGEKVRGVSGGERKRVSIGLEILRGPKVMFLDECTSGLDSFQALRVATTIKELAQGGRTIVSSIHQPRSSIFQLFDWVILVSEGRMVYQGEAKLMAGHFARLEYPLPEGFNPPDHALDLVSIDTRSEELEAISRERLDYLTENNELPVGINNVVSFEGDEEEAEKIQGRKGAKGGRKYETAWYKQFYLLLQRSFRNKIRDKGQTVIALFTSCFFGTLLGLVYFQTGANPSQKAINDKVGLIFFITLNQAFGGILSVSQFPIENQIVNRERTAKSYSVFPFFLSKIIVDLPSLLNPILLCTISYWLAAFVADAAVYFQSVFLVCLAYLSTASLGLFISTMAGTTEKTTALSFPLMLIFVLFSGFYANTDLIPDALAWIQWISPMRWVFAAFCVIQFEGVEFSCEDAALEGCIPNGEALINRLGFSEDSFGRSVGVLLGIVYFFQFLAYVVIRTKKVALLTPKIRKDM